MKTQLQQLIGQALQQLQDTEQLALAEQPQVRIERTRDRSHGDYACNIAMLLAKQVRRKPRKLAELIVTTLPSHEHIEQVQVAGPGFINFHLSSVAYHDNLRQILTQQDHYGRSTVGAGQRVQVEFVSANPTGPLHVGHGRGAAFGATVSQLLAAVGFDVQREYYVNDAGRQMHILAVSVWLRYLEYCGQTVPFPANGYRGTYIRDIAQQLQHQQGDRYAVSSTDVLTGLPADEAAGGDKEQYIDALTQRAQTLLDTDAYQMIFNTALNAILDDIRDDLQAFGVEYDVWFSERSLTDSGAIERALERLQANGHLYEQDGALWFRSTAFGDEKDRVVRRDNGQTTYFASDIAYHMNKFERVDRVINVWGADHHGYIDRVQAALQALFNEPKPLDILLVQFANLYRGGERMQMSTRSGEFVTLRELRDEVGNDAARFFYVTRRSEQHLDFDLDLAKSQSKDNPVYYIQYAHARVCRVLERCTEQGYTLPTDQVDLNRLTQPHEQILLADLSRYPEVLETAALNHEPHQLAHYLRELANAFHSYYNEHKVLIDDAELRSARLALSLAVRQIIANGLILLGVSAPESM